MRAADLRHGLVPQSGALLGGRFAAVLLVLGVDLDDLLDGLLEGRRAAFGDDLRIGERLLPRASERDHGVGTETDVGGLVVEAYPLRPGLGDAADGGGLYKQAQSVSAAVAAGNLEGFRKTAEFGILAVCPSAN